MIYFGGYYQDKNFFVKNLGFFLRNVIQGYVGLERNEVIEMARFFFSICCLYF